MFSPLPEPIFNEVVEERLGPLVNLGPFPCSVLFVLLSATQRNPGQLFPGEGIASTAPQSPRALAPGEIDKDIR